MEFREVGASAPGVGDAGGIRIAAIEACILGDQRVV